MNLEIIILSEVNQKQIHDISYKWNLKEIQMNLYTKQTHRHRKLTWLPKGNGLRDKHKCGINIYTLLYLK